VTPVTEPEVHIIGPDGLPVGVVRRPPPPPSRPWLHALLLAATFATTTLLGVLQFGSAIELGDGDLWLGFLPSPRLLSTVISDARLLGEGLSFSVPLLAILLTHEAGHYLACRRRRLDATLPYFIPVPFGIGTLGAFIRIKSPLLSKRELLDVGASGPLAGFAVTLPLLVAGIALSTPVPALPPGGYVLFGEPPLFWLLARLIHPDLAAGGDIFVHPMGMAAWFGLLVTALNLLPFGQLDGGHVAYAALGRLHRRLAWPALLALLLLGVLWSGWWLWAAIALVMGVRHPWIPDEPVPLDGRRRAVAWACLVVFALSFTPAPVTVVP